MLQVFSKLIIIKNVLDFIGLPGNNFIVPPKQKPSFAAEIIATERTGVF